MTRRWATLVTLGLLAALIPLLTPPPALAAATVDDYPTGLKNAPQDSLVDPWQFYNRECTSFVAWRLNHASGIPFNDYFQGAHWGNASHWAAAAKAVGVAVDNNPVVGAVAWWAAGSAGSSRGHVAWVQSASSSAITIEEYNYLHEGGYDVRTIYSSSSLWPSGFIHVKDQAALKNTAPPSISGTAQVGVKLTTSRGSWSAKKIQVGYQWYANGTAIPGATARAFTPNANQLGTKLKAVVTATKSGMSASTAKTSATAPVVPGVFNATAPPTVSGTPQVGLALSATSGTWTPAGAYTYQWFVAGKKVNGATSTAYTPRPGQLGKALTVEVTASAAGYTTQSVTSAASTAIAPGAFSASGPPTVAGVPQVDHPLTVTAPTFVPTGKVTYQWQADGQPIAGATGTSYTPTPDNVGQQITAVVSVATKGYQTSSTASAATDKVAPGTFLMTEGPSISGTPKVGVPLTAVAGTWSPAPTFTYQWSVGGTPVSGATGTTYTPVPGDLGQTVSLQVTATRPGYNATLGPLAQSAPVVPGDITSTAPPTISGSAVVSYTLTAGPGSWSVTPESLTYQWLDDGQPIAGATGSTYQVAASDAGHRITVQVTASATAYNPKTAMSKAKRKVVFGQASFRHTPRLAGKAVVGHTLRIRVGAVSPAAATASYRWFRGGKLIHGAHDKTYQVRPADVGNRLHVEVTLKATNWTSATLRSRTSLVAKAVPTLTPKWSIRNGRVLVDLRVRAPGVSGPRGLAQVLDGTHVVGRIHVTGGHGSTLLARLPSGRHRLRIEYAGTGPQVAAHLGLPVVVP